MLASQDYQKGRDLLLLAGDFNVLRDPLNSFMKQLLISHIDTKFTEFFPKLDNEILEIWKILSVQGCMKVIDLWPKYKQNKEEKCITYGKTYCQSENDQICIREPLEKILTSNDEQMSEQGLDYIV